MRMIFTADAFSRLTAAVRKLIAPVKETIRRHQPTVLHPQMLPHLTVLVELQGSTDAAAGCGH